VRMHCVLLTHWQLDVLHQVHPILCLGIVCALANVK
jgi:hypothetical protein